MTFLESFPSDFVAGDEKWLNSHRLLFCLFSSLSQVRLQERKQSFYSWSGLMIRQTNIVPCEEVYSSTYKSFFIPLKRLTNMKESLSSSPPSSSYQLRSHLLCNHHFFVPVSADFNTHSCSSCSASIFDGVSLQLKNERKWNRTPRRDFLLPKKTAQFVLIRFLFFFFPFSFRFSPFFSKDNSCDSSMKKTSSFSFISLSLSLSLKNAGKGRKGMRYEMRTDESWLLLSLDQTFWSLSSKFHTAYSLLCHHLDSILYPFGFFLLCFLPPSSGSFGVIIGFHERKRKQGIWYMSLKWKTHFTDWQSVLLEDNLGLRWSNFRVFTTQWRRAYFFCTQRLQIRAEKRPFILKKQDIFRVVYLNRLYNTLIKLHEHLLLSDVFDTREDWHRTHEN